MNSCFKRIGAALCAAALAFSLAACGGTQAAPGANTAAAQPVRITVWNYYNGDQLECFNKLVEEFNATVGKEQNITVTSESQGSVNDLETNVLAAAEGKVGAAALPNIFSAYADTCYAVDQMGLLADLSGYLTEEEKAAYLDSYLTEGEFKDDGSIKIFPVAKSTEILCLNETDWEPFAAATGASCGDLSTMEGLVATAQKYYEWTDAQTAAPDDGKALFGRDAMANYLLIGAKELGENIFDVQQGVMTVELSEQTARKLWDNYYVPFVKGWFAAIGRFRSDDIKTGNILCYVGSSSSATFFPKQVMTSDTESHDIRMKALPCPTFADGSSVSVQQGAGMAVTNGSEAEVKASVAFLKWMTQPEQNIRFAVGSGYLPVTHAANDMEAIEASGLEMNDAVRDILTVATDEVKNNELYTPKAFAGGAAARKVLELDLSDKAAADRATVEQRIAAGESAGDAQAEFLTDEAFAAWYQGLLGQLKAYEG